MTNSSAKQAGHKRILVTGGAGEMGAYACRALAKADGVGQVLVADRDRRKAERLAAELGPGATPLVLDIADADALNGALAGVDIVLNTAGPFYRFGREVLSAAIATSTNYLDICDDWEPTLEMLELDDAARAAGVTAVIGMGASPGTSNLLALLAMNRCDTVDRVYTAWRAGALPYPTPEDPDPQPNAALEHWVHNCTEPIKTWRRGRLTDAWALEELTLSYPGRGEGPVWVCGHPEPLTLPRVRPEVQESLNLMVSRRGLMEGMQRVAARVRGGELNVTAASRQILREPNTGGAAAGPSPILPNLFAVAEGTKDGNGIRVGARPIVLPDANMGEMTGYPLAIATLMMARGDVDKPGVHGPEGAVDPETYFHELSLLVEDHPGGPVVEVVSEEI
ncbi:NAD-dependent epimerase/dehydratase family protein [Actinomadura sp. KC216]|uniref:saccharopine dehydrogenase family protein n=1 Tax=Actinomadura sp. KC216 TaxID=2530370 RepID=UPI001053DF28|nr:saccharopine dehydrogenase NADP-binding domain-containing protein [Actinomadura sp. KC216]TDB88733.1 NAD-dependent epimerase/dehydratase family protein [Actinomadura sp. KC216]